MDGYDERMVVSMISLVAAFVGGALLLLAFRIGLAMLKWGLLVLLALGGVYLVLVAGSALGL